MISKENISQNSLGMKSEIIIENIVVKAIHDFLEEQNFVYILPATISSITSKLTLQADEDFLVELVQSRLRRSQAFVTAYQIILHGLSVDNIYSIEHVITPKNATKTLLHLENTNMNYDQILRFVEIMMRRIIVDLQDKMVGETIVEALKEISQDWISTFVQIDRHNMELEYFDDWKVEATNTSVSPFIVTCVAPRFYDQIDQSQNGDHYLNFQCFLPQYDRSVIEGGLREYRYEWIMKQMKRLGINRYDYSNYLLFLADNKLKSSSGLSINIGYLVSALIANISTNIKKTDPTV